MTRPDEPHPDALHPDTLHPDTLAVSHGYDPHAHHGAAKPPIYPSTTYMYRSAQHAKDVHRAYFDGVPLPGGEAPGHIYSRLGHPNLDMVERRLAALDRAEDSAAFNSGMAAISAVMLSALKPGDAVLHGRPIYGGTDGLLTGLLAGFGVKSFGFGDGLDRDAVLSAALRGRGGGSPRADPPGNARQPHRRRHRPRPGGLGGGRDRRAARAGGRCSSSTTPSSAPSCNARWSRAPTSP